MPGPIPRGPFDQGLFLAHFNKGQEHFDARRLDEAERELEEAYLLRPRDARVLDLLGRVYFRQEKLAKAEEVYRKLIAESPDAQTLHYNLAVVCFKLGRLEDAESAFLKALELAPGNAKIHFYLGSIYERLHRYKDAIFQYRQAGAKTMVQRVEDKLAASAPAGCASGRAAPAPDDTARYRASSRLPASERPDTKPKQPAPPRDSPFPPPKVVEPVSPTLMAEAEASLSEAARLQLFSDTMPPTSAGRPRSVTLPAPPPGTPRSEIFRPLDARLLEVDFSGKVFIKLGTIYSYSGNLNFWVKDRRPGGQPTLVIVTGTGRLLLTDAEREITLLPVEDEPVFIEPSHLLACEEKLSPQYKRVGEGPEGLEVVALEGRGWVALSVAGRSLPLPVKPALPVSVPTTSVILWTGRLTPHLVEDPQVFEVMQKAADGAAGRVLRLEGSGRVLVEQTKAP